MNLIVQAHRLAMTPAMTAVWRALAVLFAAILCVVVYVLYKNDIYFDWLADLSPFEKVASTIALAGLGGGMLSGLCTYAAGITTVLSERRANHW